MFLNTLSSYPAPSDYTAGPYSVTFPVESTTATVTFPIVEDTVYEGKVGPEEFTATISTSNTGVPGISAGEDDTATVSIVDNEGELQYIRVCSKLTMCAV